MVQTITIHIIDDRQTDNGKEFDVFVDCPKNELVVSDGKGEMILEKNITAGVRALRKQLWIATGGHPEDFREDFRCDRNVTLVDPQTVPVCPSAERWFR